MRLTATISTAMLVTGRALLLVVSPLQNWVTRQHVTHAFINSRARHILAADGHVWLAQLLGPLAQELDRGSDWADSGWKNVTHMYDPRRGRGMWDWPDATEVCGEYFGKATQAWRDGRSQLAAFYLGAAAHIVQDLCVPHHATNRLLDGHSAFEALAETVRGKYVVFKGGIYDAAQTPAGWVRANAEIAQSYLFMAGEKASKAQMEQAIAELLPLAQRTTAGFFHLFFRTVGEA